LLRHLTLALAIAAPATATAQEAVGGLSAGAAGIVPTAVVPAYQPEPTLSVGVGVSTMGITVTPEARLSDRVGIRLPVGYFTIDDSFDVEGNDVDGEATSAQGALLVDYYPGGGRFRLSAGLSFGGYQVDASGTDLTVTDTATGLDYTVNGDYSARIEQNSNLAPMLSLGFASRADSRVRLSFDIGAKFTRYGLSVDTTQLEADPNFDRTDIDQLIADFNEDADDYPVTPYLQFSVAVRF